MMKIGLAVVLGLCMSSGVYAAVYQANGIKIGEVDQDSARIWTRLTRNAELNINGTAFPKVKGKDRELTLEQQIPAGKTLDEMDGAVPGMAGEVQLTYQAEGGEACLSGWKKVNPQQDFTKQFELTGLKPATPYALKIESRDSSGTSGQTIAGKFRTAPTVKTVVPITFAVVTGQAYTRRDDPEKGHKIYPHILALNPDFFVHTGDIEYFDHPYPYATTPELVHFKMTRVYGLPNLVEFHKNVASYFIKDDHETLKNDAWPGQTYGELTWEMGIELFREQFPVLEKNYRTIRWGKDLQIWLVEGRDFRSHNDAPDGPGKTIWGAEQKAWLYRTVKASDATFKVLITPTPIVGPDRGKKSDNHANEGFAHEGNEVRQFIASQKNMYSVCGDRHWQYVSVDQTHGAKEFSCGPTSDKHAGGWPKNKKLPEHKYLNVQGGFLTITVEQQKNNPVLIARHYDVDGTLCNEDVNSAK